MKGSFPISLSNYSCIPSAADIFKNLFADGPIDQVVGAIKNRFNPVFDSGVAGWQPFAIARNRWEICAFLPFGRRPRRSKETDKFAI